MDRAAARYINDNFADYLVAVNADVDQLDVILMPEQDDRVNPAGIKGLGELGNVGTAAAIANEPGNASATSRSGSTNFAPDRPVRRTSLPQCSPAANASSRRVRTALQVA
jgi:hypothetical protein